MGNNFTTTEATGSSIEISRTDVINTAKGPKKIIGDEGSVEEREIDDLIKADQYQQRKQVTGPPFGMKIARALPPSTT